MTRIEQALRWWRNHGAVAVTIPPRHLRALEKAGCIQVVEDDGHVRFVDLTDETKTALDGGKK